MEPDQETIDTEADSDVAAAPPGDVASGPAAGGDEGELEHAAEDIVADIATIANQRDEYLAVAQRLQAEFENYKRRVGRELAEKQTAGKAELASSLLAVLDACDNAIIQGVEGVGPIHKVLFETLTKEGLEVIVADDQPFDPNHHEAVIHEPAEGDEEPRVTETLRTGYLWKGRVLRPAMVKVRG